MQIEVLRSFGKTIRTDIADSSSDDAFVRLKTEYPVISTGDNKVDDRLNAYYRKLIEELIKNTARRGNDMNVSCFVTYFDNELYSLFFNVKQYCKKELVLYIRFSENRRKNGLMIPPADVFLNRHKIKAEGFLLDIDDWYITENGIITFKNSFEVGMGAGIRRSDEDRFVETHTVSSSKLRSEWRDFYSEKANV